MSKKHVPTLVDQLTAAAVNGKAVLRELQLETKRLQGVRDEIHHMFADWQRETALALDAQVDELVKRESQRVELAVQAAEKRIVRDFRELENLVLSGSRRGHDPVSGMDRGAFRKMLGYQA